MAIHLRRPTASERAAARFCGRARSQSAPAPAALGAPPASASIDIGLAGCPLTPARSENLERGAQGQNLDPLVTPEQRRYLAAFDVFMAAQTTGEEAEARVEMDFFLTTMVMLAGLKARDLGVGCRAGG